MILLILFAGFALTVSFVCSLLESALFSTRIPTLMEQRDDGRKGAALLLEIKQTRLEDAISAILIVNTLANTVGATLAGAQAARVFDSPWVGIFSGVLAFLILVFSEIIPKTLGAIYYRSLTGFVGYSLRDMMRFMGPVLILSGFITKLFRKETRIPFSRGELAAAISTASKEGTISKNESAVLGNLLDLHSILVEDVMTPRTVCFMMSSKASVADLLAEPESDIFSRIPLYLKDRDQVIGYVLHRDVLKAATGDTDRKTKLTAFLREIGTVSESESVATALRELIEKREAIAVVLDSHAGVAGLVSLEDLTEAILGQEIVDESDQVADLRQAAADLRDQRLQRLKQRREAISPHPDSTSQ